MTTIRELNSRKSGIFPIYLGETLYYLNDAWMTRNVKMKACECDVHGYRSLWDPHVSLFTFNIFHVVHIYIVGCFRKVKSMLYVLFVYTRSIKPSVHNVNNYDTVYLFTLEV